MRNLTMSPEQQVSEIIYWLEHLSICWVGPEPELLTYGDGWESGARLVIKKALQELRKNTGEVRSMTTKHVPLKPCPFCGGEAEYGFLSSIHWVRCKICQVVTPAKERRTDAVKAWNLRIVEPPK